MAKPPNKLPRSRGVAKALGLKQYQGNPCKRGHSGRWRYTANGRCVRCTADASLASYYRKKDAKKKARSAITIPPPPVPVLPMVPHPQPTSWWASLKRRVFGEGSRV